MKLFLCFVLTSLFSIFVSCKKATVSPIYIQFTSDSSGVFGEIINNATSRILYPSVPYEVEEGQTVIFGQNDTSKTNIFNITAEVGNYNYFTPDNKYHYKLRNQYFIVIKY